MIPFSNPPHDYMVSPSQQSQPMRLLSEPQPLCAPVPMDFWQQGSRSPGTSAQQGSPAQQKFFFCSITLSAKHSWSPGNAPQSRQSSSLRPPLPEPFLAPSAAREEGGIVHKCFWLPLSHTHTPHQHKPWPEHPAQLQFQAEEHFGSSSIHE